MKKIKRALISVSDKKNLKTLLNYLKKFKIEIISSGGTYKEIRRLKNFKMILNEVKTPTPFSFPLLVERLKNTLSNEPIEKRVEKLIKKYGD